MAKDTFEDVAELADVIGAALAGYSVDAAKVVLLMYLRDTLEREAPTREALFQRADQVADYIKTSRYAALAGPNHV